jgi:outer membrane protein OmpA-like peptidoglycan-associated protein
MKRTRLLLIALVAGASSFPAHAPAAEAPTKDAIICALDPNCAKPKQPQQLMRGWRGVTKQGAQPEEPLSINLYVNFPYNSADLTSDARITLDGLGSALGDPRLKDFSFVIAGHTDAKGGVDFNQKLSERRAEAVRNYMVSQFGIATGRVSAKGYGKSQLLDPEHPEDGVNRRVQVINATAGSREH